MTTAKFGSNRKNKCDRLTAAVLRGHVGTHHRPANHIVTVPSFGWTTALTIKDCSGRLGSGTFQYARAQFEDLHDDERCHVDP
jgi:hypothetical protein